MNDHTADCCSVDVDGTAVDCVVEVVTVEGATALGKDVDIGAYAEA